MFLLGSLLLVLAVAGGLALMLPARGPLLAGRAAMVEGRAALLRGETDRAREAFARGEAAFRDAGDRLSNPLTTLASVVPVLGRTPDAVVALSEGGELVAAAGGELASAGQDLPGGLAALAPLDGVIRLEPFHRVGPSLGRARGLVAEADDVLGSAPRALVPEVVAGPLAEFAAEVDEGRRALVAAEAVARAVPAFLGEDGPRRYFVGAQTPSELRGTGGLIGAFAILTADRGRIELSGFRDVGRLGRADPAALEPPSEDYEDLYGSNHVDFSNINMTPDVPTAAAAIERLYEEVTGERLDGTILADPHALALLLRGAGPTTVPGTGTTVSASEVVPFVANEAYALLPDDDARKRVLGEVAGAALGYYLGTGAAADPAGAGRTLVEAAAEGHLLFHAVDPTVQEALGAAGVTGALGDPAGDFLAVIVNNAGGNKIDFYADRTLRYHVTLLEDGLAAGELGVTFRNDAPTSGQPAYVIGPHPFTDARPGDNTMIVQTYCARRCGLEAFNRDGVPEVITEERELGHPVTVTGVRVSSGQASSLTYSWTTADAWHEEGSLIVYRLTVRGQPTIRPTDLELAVRIPEGTDPGPMPSGMEVDGDRVVWRGELGEVETFEVAFERPFPAGIIGRVR